MIALTSVARENRGVSHAEVTRRLLIRGLVLIAVDAVIMGLPRALMGFYSFMVLSSIGVAIIAMAFLRNVSSWILAPIAVGVLVLHPLLDVSALPTAVRAVLYEPVREGAFRSLYPIIPWGAIVLLGFVVGRDALTRTRPERFWAVLALLSLAAFIAVRLSSGYGNAYPYTSVASLDFCLRSAWTRINSAKQIMDVRYVLSQRVATLHACTPVCRRTNLTKEILSQRRRDAEVGARLRLGSAKIVSLSSASQRLRENHSCSCQLYFIVPSKHGRDILVAPAVAS
jgi:uncharacterized membrane protein